MRLGEKSSDAELVFQILDGHDNAFSLLHSRYEARLFSYAFKRTRNHEDAKDIVQETFFEIWQHLSELKDPKMFAN